MQPEIVAVLIVTAAVLSFGIGGLLALLCLAAPEGSVAAQSVAEKPPGPPVLPDGWQAVLPHAGEIFFPKAPYAGAVYEIEIDGECRYYNSSERAIQPADALYRAPHGRFSDRHRELRINNRPLLLYSLPRFEIVEIDRGKHAYKIRIDDLGQPISIAFGDPSEARVRQGSGFLSCRVTPLHEGTPGIRWRQEQEKKRAETKARADEVANRLSAAVAMLSVRALTFRNWGDPAYREKFARAHYDELIKNQADIRKEATELLSQHTLVQYFARHNPTVLTTLLGRLETLQLAEVVALEKRLGPMEPVRPLPVEPKKAKLNAGQVRELKLWHQQRDAEDKLTLVKDKIAREQEAKKWVMEKYPELPEDEQAAMYQQVLEHLYEDADHGKIL